MGDWYHRCTSKHRKQLMLIAFALQTKHKDKTLFYLNYDDIFAVKSEEIKIHPQRHICSTTNKQKLLWNSKLGEGISRQIKQVLGTSKATLYILKLMKTHSFCLGSYSLQHVQSRTNIVQLVEVSVQRSIAHLFQWVGVDCKSNWVTNSTFLSSETDH